MSQRTVGLIGVGLVGMALAERLHGAGWEVIGFDIADHARAQLMALTGRVAAEANEVVATADTVILSLPTSQIAAAVVHDLNVPLSGKTIIDTTTGEPAEMQALGERLAQQGAQYLDATIAGSSAHVRSGEVVLMVGGKAPVVAACDDLLRSFSSRIFHIGAWGAGARMKLIVNLVLGLNRAVLAEGLCFAEHCGVDPRQALEVLRAGPAFSKVMDTKGEKMLTGDFTPQARLAQHLKDVRLILSSGETTGAKLPLSRRHEELLDQLDRSGLGDLDNSAIIKAFES